MRYIVALMITTVLLTPLASSQTPSNEWEIGWEDDSEPDILQLDSSFNFDITIEFWIENSRPVPADIEFEVESNEDFTIDDPGSVSVPANSNETFEISISGSGLDDANKLIDARGQYYDVVTIIANLMVGGQSSDSKEIEKQLQFSPVYEFDYPSINDINLKMKAGTDKEITVEIENKGNVDDAIKKIDFSFKSCPQMDFVVVSGLAEGTVISTKVSGVIKLISPSSHPDKTCTFEVNTVSEGSSLGYVGRFDFNVEAPEVISEDDEDDQNGENQVDSPMDDNSLPYLPFSLSILTVIFAAILRK
ncbi:MAG: hypothetical protein VW862_06270 [Euryarchaeota archaeon]